MSDQLRLFVALELPPHVLKALEETQARLRAMLPDRSARWARIEGIHLTLKFLGNVSARQIDELGAALRVATMGYKPFELHIEKLGVFPRPHAARVLWAGVTGDTHMLHDLQKAVEREIASLGYPSEHRPFNPHLTLARANRNASRSEKEALGTLAEKNKIDKLASWRVDAVSLMRSQLKPGGAVYTRLKESQLASPDPDG